MSAEGSGRSRPPGIFAYLLNELRQGWQDIRQKLVEEGWFGRVVTARPVIEVEQHFAPDREAALPGRPSFDERWAPRDRESEVGRDHDHHHQPDLGLDR